MNANELAKLLEVDSWYKLVTREEIAAMLRQQQEQIENLKQWEKRQLNVIEAQQAEIEAKELYINRLHKLCNANKLGVGKDLLTGEIIPFEVNDEQ